MPSRRRHALYAGVGTTGPAYVLEVSCLSDEIVFDARVSEKTIECVATAAGDLLTKITGRATTAEVSISGDAITTRIGGFQPLAGKSWSENVGALGNAARASLSRCEQQLAVRKYRRPGTYAGRERRKFQSRRIQGRAHTSCRERCDGMRQGRAAGLRDGDLRRRRDNVRILNWAKRL